MSFNLTRCVLLVLLITGSLCYTANGQSSPGGKNFDKFAGIEVGSKGVKLSVLEMGKSSKKDGYTILKDTSVNTDFISFSQTTSQATLNGLYDLYEKAINEYNIPEEQVYTVISSGVKMQAEKDDQMQEVSSLINSFRQKIKQPEKKVEVVDVREEARLSHLGIIPEARRYTTFLIDIGSGNTKGGFFPLGNVNNFRLFQVDWGTKSIANATEKRIDEFDQTLSNYQKQLNRVLQAAENSDIIYAINSSGAYPMSDNITFSGGIAWSIATLIRPEDINKSSVRVTYKEVSDFAEKLLAEYKSLADTELSKKGETAEDKKKITEEVKRVHKVFDQRSLMSGTGLLLKIMRQFTSVYESKQFDLVKNGQVGWISAYVNKAVK